MSNEAMRLPSGEVNSSVHYQKMFALSKTLNSHTAVLPELTERRRKTPFDLLMLSAHRKSQRPTAYSSSRFLFRFGCADSEVGQFT
jgi:hypothetical protein